MKKIIVSIVLTLLITVIAPTVKIVNTSYVVSEPKASAGIIEVAKLILQGGKYVIQWGSKIFKKAPKDKVTNALSKYKTGTYKTGSYTYNLTKTDMKHMLERHHPKYWNGTAKTKQTFLNPNLSVTDVKKIALSIAKQNKKTLSKKGTNSTFQVTGKVDGVTYVLGITKGHIKQLYPKY